ncbi:hypothetical protein [Sphaerisporangium corydalis]|uniref:Uncharacterized protein n=1 Tax=Sphaerisporangium corydalis TaxID=1441875 RepID=A0ABV9EP38_9ACTN|nr:hypothetical protein [Sphaerisporangium corydalis]
MSGRVVRLDLRGTTGEEALDQTWTLLSDQRQADLTLLLLVDDVTALKPHQRAYEALVSSRYTDELLCVAVGPIGGNPQRLEVPGSLAQAAGILWVPDLWGIDWRLAAAAPALRRQRGQNGEGALAHLLDTLSHEGIFRRTCELVQRSPGLMTNPGLRLAGIDGGQGDFAQAFVSAAAQRLTTAAGRAPDLPVPQSRRPAAQGVRLRESSPLANAVEQARSALAEASAAADELGETTSLFAATSAAGAVTAEAGQSLDELRHRLEDLFSVVHASTGLSSEQHEVIERAGVVLPDMEEFDPTLTRGSIEKYIDQGLSAGTSLRTLVEGLDRLQERLMPRGGKTRIPELHQACPEALSARLRLPDAMVGPQPWMPVIGLAASAMAALTPFGPASGLMMASLWTLLVALTVVRGPGGRLARHAAALACNAVAGVVGTTAAWLGVIEPLPSVAWALLLIAALVLAVWGSLVSWRARTARWAAERGLDTAEKAVDELLALVAKAVQDWTRAGASIAAADAVARMSAALDRVADALDDQMQRLGEGRALPRTRDRFVERYLADLVRVAMAPRLRTLASGSIAEHGEKARRDTAELVTAWEEHAAEHGLYSRPPFGKELVVESIDTPGEELPELVTAAAADPHDAMWQLCSADDLPLLDLSAAPSGVVRFAPERGRGALEDLLPAGTVWTSSGRHAGTLRLVPVRPGVAYQSWTAEPEQEATR